MGQGCALLERMGIPVSKARKDVVLSLQKSYIFLIHTLRPKQVLPQGALWGLPPFFRFFHSENMDVWTCSVKGQYVRQPPGEP